MLEQVGRLVNELEPILNPDKIVSSENRWRIVLHQDQAIDIDFESGLNRILLSTRVAPVDKSRAETTYKQLLQYNALWATTGGLIFALSGDPAEATLMIELPVAELDLETLFTVIQNFAERSANWKAIITREFEQLPDVEVQAEMVPDFSIKV